MGKSKTGLLDSIIKLTTINLGKNPLKGGKPPNERKVIEIKVFNIKLLLNKWDK